METFSALLAICAGNSPVPGEFLAQRPVTRSFDIFFDLRLNKRLSKQSWGWWFETLSCPLWRHSNGNSTKPPQDTTKRESFADFLGYIVDWRDCLWINIHLHHLSERVSVAWGIHYDDVIMTVMASQITILTIVYSAIYSGAYQRKHQSSASLAFVRGIHRGPVNSGHKWPVTRKMFPFDDVIILMIYRLFTTISIHTFVLCIHPKLDCIPNVKMAVETARKQSSYADKLTDKMSLFSVFLFTSTFISLTLNVVELVISFVYIPVFLC